jgi:hypothetical protein
MAAAIERDGDGQRALLDGDRHAAGEAFGAAAELYRRSWEAAPPGSFGRLVGLLKSAVLAGAGEPEADYVLASLPAEETASPTASYARAIAALIVGDDDEVKQSAAGMRAGAKAFGRAADALDALARRDGGAYTASLRAVVHDFENRDQHLTGVPIADTALLLERLAQRRGMAAGVRGPLVPDVLG